MNAREIAIQALQQPTPAEHAAFLEEVCGSNVDLRRQVEGILLTDPASDLVEQPPANRAAYDPTVVSDKSQLEQPGSWIGPYKLLQPLGEGGMGMVYMAEQTEPIARRVALKIIKPGIDTRQVIARFEAERQALALMDHPCIAKVYDAGATASGRPYFVMELVKGVPITTYCDKEQLPVVKRLELFVRVCQGVQHAHLKGIIHRDIKPSNILVALHDSVAVPTIIDFGLAKATGQRLTEKTLFTEFGQVVGTLEYMSPEQAELNQLNIDTRTDIYSLGAVLYELLTGAPPLDRVRTRSAAFDEVLRIIREEEPQHPSTRVSSLQEGELSTISQQRGIDPRKLPSLFRAELDWVVMKALDKKRTRRYETASDMARDIQRYLTNEAVEARPASAAYRLRKFVGRHKVGTAAAVSGVLVLLTATAGLAISNRLIGQEKSKTENALNASRLSEAKASRNAALAEEQRNIAEQQRDEKARQLYVAHMQIAHQEWKENHAARTRELLDAYLPENHGGVDWRGWEWHYLWRLSHSELRVIHKDQDSAALAIAYLPDGKSFVTGDGTGALQIWNADGTEQLRSWRAHHDPQQPENSRVQKIAISADGSVMATAGTEVGVKLWDIASGTLLRTFPSLGGTWSGLAMTADHTRIAVPSAEPNVGQITVFDVATGDVVRRFSGDLLQFAFSADGRRLAAVGGTRVQQWNMESGEELKNITTNGHRQTAVAVSPDGHIIVSGDASGAVMFWDADSGKGLRWHQAHNLQVERVVFSADGTRLASASRDSTICIWDVNSRTILQTFRGQDECVDVCFVPNSDVVVSCGWDESIRFWDALSQGEPDWRSDYWYVNHVEFSPDGRSYALSDNRSLSLHDATTHRRVWIAYFVMRDVQTGILTSPWGIDAQGRWIAAGHVDEGGGRVRICDMETGNAIRTFRAHNLAVASLQCFPDGRMATGSQDGEIAIWNADGEHEAARFRAHNGTVVSLAVSPDNKLIASGGTDSDRKIHLWNSTDGRHVRELTGCEGGLYALVFSRDGQTLFSADRSRLLRSWEVATGRPLLARNADANSLAVSPDGKRIASCGGDQTVKIWDATLDMEVLTIRCSKGTRRSLSFSPDSWRLASGGEMQGEFIWDARPLTPELRAVQTNSRQFNPPSGE